MGRIVGGATGINSGLIRNNAVCKSYQRFATAGTSTWHKPANANWVYLEIIGGGGSGGGGGSAPQVDADYAGGGGGAALLRRILPAEYVPNTLTVVVGAVATGPGENTVGVDGNFSSVTNGSTLATDFIFKSYGGKGGPKGGHAWPSAGSGGAGVGAMGGAGTTGSSQTSAIAGGTGGLPFCHGMTQTGDSLGGAGGGGGPGHRSGAGAANAGQCAE